MCDCSAGPGSIRLRSSTPRNADGIDPAISQATSRRFTVPCRQCTAPPTGFMIIAATMSLDTAASGSTWKNSTRIGVIRAPPPMPVRPTTKPTNRPVRMTNGSIMVEGGARGRTLHTTVAGPAATAHWPETGAQIVAPLLLQG